MKKQTVFFSVTLFLAGAAAALLAVTLLLGLRFGGRDGLHAAFRFAEARKVISERYLAEIAPDTLTEGAISGMVEAVGDRWSYYMNAETYAQYRNYSANLQSGIGISVKQSDDLRGLLVVEVVEGSPAEKAGIRADMLLLEVDGASVAGKTGTEARQMILNAGDPVPLLLETPEGKNFSVHVPLGTIAAQVVYSYMPEPGIGYIGIANFEAGAAKDAMAALQSLREEGAEKIVFDVRDNPGGQLTELLSLLDDLLPEGELFVGRDKNGNEDVRYSDAACVQMPMAVLVDENSYSAAEFFAAVLSEYDWAKIVGSQTTGKSRSQVNIPLMDGDVIHLSTAGYLTPDRVDLTENGGLTPDVPVEQGEETDLQLQAALDLLRTAA